MWQLDGAAVYDPFPLLGAQPDIDNLPLADTIQISCIVETARILTVNKCVRGILNIRIRDYRTNN
jgi:hypothetical protein